jgi:hypothetical protein
VPDFCTVSPPKSPLSPATAGPTPEKRRDIHFGPSSSYQKVTRGSARSVWRCSQGPKKVECFQIFLANARMTLSQDRVFVKLKGEIAMIRIYTRENALQRNNSDGSRLGDRESVKAMLAPVTRLFRLVFV